MSDEFNSLIPPPYQPFPVDNCDEQILYEISQLSPQKLHSEAFGLREMFSKATKTLKDAICPGQPNSIFAAKLISWSLHNNLWPRSGSEQHDVHLIYAKTVIFTAMPNHVIYMTLKHQLENNFPWLRSIYSL